LQRRIKMMPKYYVLVKEVHDSYREVEADSPEEAIEKVAAGDLDFKEERMEYSYTLDSEEWSTEECEDEEC